MDKTLQIDNILEESGEDILSLVISKSDKFEEQNEKLEKKIFDLRKFWDQRLQELFPMLKNVQQLTELEVLYLSYRHQVSDAILATLSKISKLSQALKLLKSKLKKRMNSQKKYALVKNKKEEIDVKIVGLEHRITLLKDFVEYCRSIVQTIDKLSFSVKNRIAYENFRSDK